MSMSMVQLSAYARLETNHFLVRWVPIRLVFANRIQIKSQTLVPRNRKLRLRVLFDMEFQYLIIMCSVSQFRFKKYDFRPRGSRTECSRLRASIYFSSINYWLNYDWFNDLTKRGMEGVKPIEKQTSGEELALVLHIYSKIIVKSDANLHNTDSDIACG